MHLSRFLPFTLVALPALAQGSSSNADLVANFRLYSEYADAAYCPSRPNDPIGQPVCENKNTDACLDLTNTTTTHQRFTSGELGEFNMNLAAGYVATDDVKKTITVVFRGTNSSKDVVTDLRFLLGDTKFDDREFCRDCRVHNGFRAAFASVRQDILKAVEGLKRKKPEYTKVVVTGHSLGGAVATIAAAYLRSHGHDCDLYTYGSPRVGNRQFARFVEGQNRGANFRIVNQNDLVAAVPLAGKGLVMGILRRKYDHVYPEYRYQNGLSGAGNPYEAQFQTYRENAPRACAAINMPGCRISERIKQHSRYANADAKAETFKPCGERKPKTVDEEPDLSAEEEKELQKNLIEDEVAERVDKKT